MFYVFSLYIVCCFYCRETTCNRYCDVSASGVIRTFRGVPAVVRLIKFLAILTEIEISLLFSLPHTTVFISIFAFQDIRE